MDGFIFLVLTKDLYFTEKSAFYTTFITFHFKPLLSELKSSHSNKT